MNRILLLALIFITQVALAQPGLKAIVDVSLIPMDREIILEHQTVLIDGNKITALGSSSKIKIPKGAQRIDGKNKFLIPGLMDMHVHTDRTEMTLFIANGVTTVRNLNGDTTHLSLRKKIERGLLTGPRIFTAGPLITGPSTPWKIKAVPASADEARKIVQEQKRLGFDFIKVYDGISKEMFDAIMEQAAIENIPVVGHIPESVGLAGVLNKKIKSIEHVEKIVYDYFGMDFDNKKIPDVARMVKNAGTWICPTLAVQEIFKLNMQGEFLPMLSNPEMKYVDKGTMGWWKSFAQPKRSSATSDHQNKMHGFYDFQVALTKGLFDAGVPIIAGTDSPNPGMIPGFALHDELRNLVLTGLSPYQALKAATSNAALFLGKEKEFGMIKEGMTADLVLLEGNPLQDIKNTKRQAGVMVRGKWYSREEIKSMLDKF